MIAARLVAAIAATGLLSSCAFGPQLQAVAVNQNQMVADAEDELTLLNIVRASQRFPLHFTTISEVNGNAQLRAGLALDLTLEDGPNTHEPGGSLGVQTTPSYKASVLVTEKFQRGIQQPISPQTVASYLEAGWPDELVLALLVERIDVYATAKSAAPIASIHNEPGISAGFGDLLCNYTLDSRPTASSKPLAGFADLIDLDMLASSETSAKKRRSEISEFLALIDKDGVSLAGDTLFLSGSSNSVVVEALEKSRCEAQADKSLSTADAVLVPRFRSTQGVIYFLGEYIRAARDGPVYLLPFSNDECGAGETPAAHFRPILQVESGNGPDLIETEFRGQRYFVPQPSGENCVDGATVDARTMQVIAIVQQLLNLHKSSEDLPTSISVTGID